MGNVKRGDIVIINDWDKPTAELLAVVTKVDDDGVAQALYITSYPRLSSRTGRNPTRIEDFGQRVEFHQDGGQVRTVTAGVSEAKDEDGSPRTWQDSQPGKWWKCRLSVGALKALGVEVTPFIPAMMGFDLGEGDHTVVYHGETDPT